MTKAPSSVRKARLCLTGAVKALLVMATMTATGPNAALGQNARGITVKVPPVIAAEPNGETRLPIAVEPASAIPGKSFVRVRGLPPMAALSEGYVIAAGSWAVPISALPDLKVTLPAGTAGRSELTILLVAVDGSILVEAKTALAVAPAPRATAPAPAERTAPAGASMLRAGVPVDVAPRPPPPATAVPQDNERAQRLLARGNEQLAEGNISAARLFFERAAQTGLAEGAMALAATYDAAELERLSVRGIRPDSTQARQWYERARQLGARGAEERLRRLGATN